MNMLRFLMIALFLIPQASVGQNITAVIPQNADATQTYLFYLHGGVVQQQGVHAVSSYYGEYDYLGILDTLSSAGFQVISEARPRDTDEIAYAQKVALQVDSLLQQGVAPGKVVIVGASQGAYITLEAAYRIKRNKLNYVILGLCSDYALEYFSDYGKELHGNYLSIYESSDSKGSCESIFKDIPAETNYREIELNMGIDHAFLYKPYDEWVQPLVKWIKDS